jgi:homoserine kinase
MKQVTLTVPATTANLGPGFDCLGMALGMYNKVTLTEADQGVAVSIEGEGCDRLPANENNLVAQAAEVVFQRVGRRPAGLRIYQYNHIPIGSGLGSSAAATLGGILAANELIDGKLPPEELIWLAAEIERHPDNVVPAFYGGLTLINSDDTRLHIERIDIPLMWLVIVLPDVNLPTAVARAALPEQVPLADAIFNAGRVGLLIRALEAGDYNKLQVAMQDRLHQQYRSPLIPGVATAFEAALKAGASAVALSGAGPSIAAYAPQHHESIRQATMAAFAAAGLSSRSWILPVDSYGCRVEVSV